MLLLKGEDWIDEAMSIIIFFIVGGVILAVGNSMADYFGGDMKPIIIWGCGALLAGVLAAIVFRYYSEQYLVAVIGALGGVVLTTFVMGMFGAPAWLNLIVMIIVCAITGYYGTKYDDGIKRVGTSGLGAFMIVYGIASFFDAMPSLSAGGAFKAVYLVVVVVWLALWYGGYRFQWYFEKKTVFDDGFDKQKDEPAEGE